MYRFIHHEMFQHEDFCWVYALDFSRHKNPSKTHHHPPRHQAKSRKKSPLRWYLLALLHLLLWYRLLCTTSQWSSFVCRPDQGVVYQGWHQIGNSNGRWQVVFLCQHSFVLLGSVCYATSWGCSYVLLLQFTEYQGSIRKATGLRIVDKKPWMQCGYIGEFWLLLSCYQLPFE